MPILTIPIQPSPGTPGQNNQARKRDKCNPSGKKRIVGQLTIHLEKKRKIRLLLHVLQHQTYSNGLNFLMQKKSQKY